MDENDRDGMLAVSFEMRAVEDVRATREKGNPQFKDVPYIRIITPGDATNIIVRPATEEDKRRFEPKFLAFMKAQEQRAQGEPLKNWAKMTPAESEYFAANKVVTVEQLAALGDEAAGKLGPAGPAKRAQAQAYLSQAREAAPQKRLEAELQELRARLASSEQMLAEARSHAKDEKKPTKEK